MDFSTLNATEIKKLPTFVLPPTWSITSYYGQACYGDAPGFPSYFLRSIFRSDGNPPPGIFPQTVIELDGVLYVTDRGNVDHNYDDPLDVREAKYHAELLKLWNPLPLEHERTQAWIVRSYVHCAHCYIDDSKSGDDKILIFPVPRYRLPIISKPWVGASESVLKKIEEQEQEKARILAHAEEIALPENHLAVRIIRRFYPEYQPDLDMILNPPKHRPGDWVEREAKCPAPEDCPGSHGRKHPRTGWCQFCGGTPDEPVKQETPL